MIKAKDANVDNIPIGEGNDETDQVAKEFDTLSLNGVENGANSLEADAQSDDQSIAKIVERCINNNFTPQGENGKYEREFLLMMQDSPKSKEKPKDIDNFKQLLQTSDRNYTYGTLPRPNMENTFLPNFAKGPIQRGTSLKENKRGSMGMSNSRGGIGMSKSNVIHVTLAPREVKLTTAENPWKPSRAEKNKPNEDEAETTELYKKFQSILNKLTPDNFSKLVNKVKLLKINTKERLRGVIELVFKKAMEEPNFAPTYATLCRELASMGLNNKPDSNEKPVTFGTIIVKMCQEEFGKLGAECEHWRKEAEKIKECTDPEKQKEQLAQHKEEERAARMRALANIRFIGELYNCGILASWVMGRCIERLLTSDELKLECLCKLLTNIGAKLEKDQTFKGEFNKHIKKMHKIIMDDKENENKISNRVRFTVLDVIDLKKSNWVHKNIEINPKTMGEIQREAEEEQRNKQILNAAPRNDGPRGGKPGGRSGSSNSYDDFRPTKNYPIDHKKLQSITNTSDEVKLGPPKFRWNKGSNTKTSPKIETAPTYLQTNNMYSALTDLNTQGSKLDSDEEEDTPVYQEKSAPKVNQSKDITLQRALENNKASADEINPQASQKQPKVVPMSEEELRIIVKDILRKYTNDDSIQYADILSDFNAKCKDVDHTLFVTELILISLERPPSVQKYAAELLKYLVISAQIIKPVDFITGLTEVFTYMPDLYIDIPLVYQYITQLILPQIVHKILSFADIMKASKEIIEQKQGIFLLENLIKSLEEYIGRKFILKQWKELNMNFADWIVPAQFDNFISKNKLGYLLRDDETLTQLTRGNITPEETEKKLIELMKEKFNFEMIDSWIQDYVAERVSENWFIRTLTQAVCQQALSRDSRGLRLDEERFEKYTHLLRKYGEGNKGWELQCLFAIQKLIHRLEHPQGLSLEIFQFLSREYIIPNDVFLAWETTHMELEGKAVMLKALVSFFTQIKEIDDDSCED